MTKLNPALRAELAKLDAEQVFELLGEIVQPSIGTPFTVEDDAFTDALAPIEAAYDAAYKGLAAIVSGEDADPEAAFWAEADYRYEQRRDEIAERDLPY
jgi:hypothetical protein